MRRALLFVLVAAILPCDAMSQSVATGISRDTVRVGDPVRVILRIDGIPKNAEVVLPDSLAAVDDVENAGRLRMRQDTMANGTTRITATYPLLLWRPGETALPSIPMRVRADGRERTMQVALPTINVLSVLPADTTNIQAKPPKDVWGANRIWWPYILLALVLIALAALGYWWYKRRRQVEDVVIDVPQIDPRQRALQQLQQIREQRLIEHGEYKQFYILLSETLRGFAAALEPDWSTDLTTDELAPRLKRRPEASALMRLLRSSDSVKFARYQPNPTEARTDLDDAIGWVGSFNRRDEAPAEAA